jgi:hypothetical protein
LSDATVPGFKGVRYFDSLHNGSLSCSWAKLTAAVKNAFASSAGKNQWSEPTYFF